MFRTSAIIYVLKSSTFASLMLVRSHPPSKSLKILSWKYEVYKKYQMTVHKDQSLKSPFSQFKNFLISSPLVEETRHGVELGSFHYQYILDGKIFAVEVMDILPQFISSSTSFMTRHMISLLWELTVHSGPYTSSSS
ncbi:ATE1 [Bugula neritina]|uniref:ATE1 n=1 Tax=Bugula neritina TaxID=10212 RepID=A0A7J7JDZ5_BUGNE|nr:ATE1 [Bugula neritina]